ncbi:replicative DNA helicase [Hydrogenimonas cancrithermarum]|uniref:Replicative DNA helicase n=1 Tax=Hydrogenimonas cancrithermarum TaxID=2993563 RepID=A0ABM8FK35_9BACT|nr:replicative DNA helicase [Hydrogenimonas cancrithermarum]BDY12665.1 replicative DNA helicase [Hydrogenimonas cancrithermarum]
MEEHLYNLNIERAVLSTIVFDPVQYEEIAAQLKAEDFYHPFHQHLFMAMEELFRADQPIDEEFLREKLSHKHQFDEVAFLDILSANPLSNTHAYIKEIKAKAQKRALVTLATEIKKLTIEEDLPADDVMDAVEAKLYAITSEASTQDFRESQEMALSTLEHIKKMKERGNSMLIGVDTGFNDLNRMTSGFGEGDLVIVAARPAMGKCLGKGTKVLMYDGSLKKVEDVEVGDLLMGDDSTPRRVLSLARGREMMYWVRQNRGIDYRVNESHILSLKRSRNENGHRHGEILNIPLKEYLKKSDKFKSNYKGYKVAVEFAEKEVPVDPYFLGIWLGDGRGSDVRIATEDPEVVAFLEAYAAKLGLTLYLYAAEGKCPMYGITNGRSVDPNGAFSLQKSLRDLGMLEAKRIPRDYIANSREIRLQLLAGLVDSDGYYDDKFHVIEITQKSRSLAEDIKLLADTLGFRTSLIPKKATIRSIEYESEVYRVRIVGDLEEIPTKIPRKKARLRKAARDVSHTGIWIEPDRVDDYYGFVLDGNHLFLLEDMTVTHNTALTLNMALKALENGDGVAFFSLEMPAEQLVLRMLSAKTSIALQDLRVGNLRDEEWTRLSEAVDWLSGQKLFVDDEGTLNIHQVRAKLRKLKSHHPEIKVAIIDYLQLMSSGSNKDRHQEVSEISRGLKMLARELQIPIVALSQLNRSLEARADKRPMLSDLRESGAIEQDADIILFVYRDDVYRIREEKEKEMKARAEGKEYRSNFHEKEEEDAEIIIGKQRNGPTGIVELKFQKRFTRFVDAGRVPVEVVYEQSNIDTGAETKIELPPI